MPVGHRVDLPLGICVEGLVRVRIEIGDSGLLDVGANRRLRETASLVTRDDLGDEPGE